LNEAWPPASGDPVLPEGEVHVWLVPVAMPPQSLAVLRGLLDDGECERAHRFRIAAARERFVVSHGGVRFVLGRLTGLAPESLRFARRCGRCGRTDHGKPHLSGAHRSDIDFSLAHSGGLVLISVARGRLVGADVEWVRRGTDILAVAQHAFSPTERRAIESLATDYKRREAFFRCWTRKEAYLKARAEGLAGGLDSFSVAVLDDDPCRPEVPADPGETDRWQVRSLSTPPGYLAAVAAEGSWVLRCWKLALGQCALRQRTTLCPPNPKLFERATARRPSLVRSPSARPPSVRWSKS
jgi:4'-phosphopantetheinyl transferase